MNNRMKPSDDINAEGGANIDIKYPKNEVVFVGRGTSRSKYIIIPKVHENEVEELVEKHLINGLDNVGSHIQQKDKFLATIPGALISVTGGAQDFDMVPAKVQQVFNGLLKAAENINAWIVDGGMDAGVMAYVGKAMKEMAIENVPCIGIAPFKKVIQNELLARKANTPKPTEYVADKQNSYEMCALNPNHSHFILVDSPQDIWGEEITVRTGFEGYVRDKFKIPLIVIVVNGGAGTLETVAIALQSNFKVLIVQGSGRASDAMGALVQKAQKLNKSMGTQPVIHSCNSLLAIEDGEGVDSSPWLEFLKEGKNNIARIDKWTQNMNTILKNISGVTLFNMHDETSTDLDVYVLRTILSSVNQEDNAMALEQKLKLGILWDRLDIVTEVLDDSKNDDFMNSKSKRTALNASLLYAIQIDRPKIFTLLAQNGGQKESLDLNKLYP